MVKKLLLSVTLVTLTGCSTIKEYWPRAHDPVMFDYLVRVELGINKVNCASPVWQPVINDAEALAKYTEWRMDPQRTNLKGLSDHLVKLSNTTNKTFCELGKKTAQERVNVTKQAWGNR